MLKRTFLKEKDFVLEKLEAIMHEISKVRGKRRDDL